jgi:hypothetical protein
MASSWTEYLCLEREGDELRLSRRGYEVLAELSEYAVRDKDGEFLEYRVPEEIDGSHVEGIEGGEYVIGGSLVLHDDESELELDPDDLEGARRWLTQHEWDGQPGFEAAWQEICRALGKEAQ